MKTLFTGFLTCITFLATGQGNLIVHEWGTFTSKYTGLGVPYTNLDSTVNEKTPDFVHHIDFGDTFNMIYYSKEDYYYKKGKLDLTSTTIKMETPVLYFYSDQAIDDVEINVTFKQGSISEYYPMPTERETETHVGNSSSNGKLNMSHYSGFATWKIDVLAQECMDQLTMPDNMVPPVWLAPRQTSSNLIRSGNETEKYIFYRGLGGFTNPVIPKYTENGDLIVKNTGQPIPYAIVYEYTKKGERYIWGIQKLDSNRSAVFHRNRFNINTDIWLNHYREGFIQELIGNGLYRDEAEAMLNTWDASYFHTPGIKIFWVVPRSFTDQILPIDISYPCESLERVMIGRTEIDDYNEESKYLYAQNIYPDNLYYILSPNPASTELVIHHNLQHVEKKHLSIHNLEGQEVLSSDFYLFPFTDHHLSISDLPTGMYFVQFEGLNEVKKLVVQ